jgi:hypothetical protein
MNANVSNKHHCIPLIPFAWIATILLLAQPVSSRAGDLGALMGGKKYPLSLRLAELGKDWRRFTLHTAGNASGNVSVSVTGGGGTSGSSQNNIADLSGSKLYLTKGQTVSAHRQVYLVAYRMPGSGLDFPALIQALATKTAPQVTTLTPETELPLSLLDVRNMGSLDDIRAFNLQREIAESEKVTRMIESALKAAGGEATNNATQPAAKNPAR